MSTSKSWREIADLLGHRLENYDFCLERHTIPEENPACPFCQDRVVIAEWRRKREREQQRLRGIRLRRQEEQW